MNTKEKEESLFSVCVREFNKLVAPAYLVVSRSEDTRPFQSMDAMVLVMNIAMVKSLDFFCDSFYLTIIHKQNICMTGVHITDTELSEMDIVTLEKALTTNTFVKELNITGLFFLTHSHHLKTNKKRQSWVVNRTGNHVNDITKSMSIILDTNTTLTKLCLTCSPN